MINLLIIISLGILTSSKLFANELEICNQTRFEYGTTTTSRWEENLEEILLVHNLKGHSACLMYEGLKKSNNLVPIIKTFDNQTFEIIIYNTWTCLHSLENIKKYYCTTFIDSKDGNLIDENYSGPQIHNAYQYDIINCLEFEDNTFDSLLARSDVANILAKRYFVKKADIEARARTILNSRNNFGFVFIERKQN